MRVIVLALILLESLYLSEAFGQSNTHSEWKTLQSAAEQFSVSIPTDFEVFFDKDGFHKVRFLGKGMNSDRTGIWNVYFKNAVHVTSFSGGLSLSVSRYETDHDPYTLELFSRPHFKDSEVRTLEGKAFTAKIAVKATVDWYFLQTIVYVKGRIFHIRAAVTDRGNNSLRYFLNSLKVNDQSLFQLGQAPDNYFGAGPSIEFSKLSETPFESALIHSVSKPVNKSAGDGFQPADAKSFVSIPDELNEGISGRSPPIHRVPARVTFAADGKVSRVEFLGKGPDSRIRKRVIVAARQIRFLPRQRDGKVENMVRMIEYRSYEK